VAGHHADWAEWRVVWACGDHGADYLSRGLWYPRLMEDVLYRFVLGLVV
jgi:hypothetical protein